MEPLLAQDSVDVVAIAREVAKLLPPPPAQTTDAGYIAVFLVVLLAIGGLVFLLLTLPRMVSRVVDAIDCLGEKIDEERRAHDARSTTEISALHQKLDATRSDIADARRELAPLAERARRRSRPRDSHGPRGGAASPI